MSVVDVLKSKYTNLKNRKIVFWIDENHEFETQFNEFDFDNVKKHRITKHNNLYTKYLLEKIDTENHYLIYYSFNREYLSQNWLSDIMLYSEIFQSDFASLMMDELKITPSSNFRKVLKQYQTFFNSKERLTQLKKISPSFNQPIDLEMGIIAVLANAKNLLFVEVLSQLLKYGLDKDNNQVYVNFVKYCDDSSLNSIFESKLGYKDFTQKSLTHLWSYLSCNSMAYKVKEIGQLSDVNQFVNLTFSHICYDVLSDLRQDNKISLVLYDTLDEVQSFLKLDKKLSQLDMKSLIDSDVFPVIHAVVFDGLYKKLIKTNNMSKEVMDAIAIRKELNDYQEVSAFYEALFYASKLIKFKEDHGSAIPFADLPQLWDQYQHDYYQMDQYYRYFVYWVSKGVLKANEHFDDVLKDLSDSIENLYKNWFLEEMGYRWTMAIENKPLDSFPSSIVAQRNFYNQYISSWVNQNVRTFVIISDAMRFEVGKELSERLSQDSSLTTLITPMIASTPSITKIGMASLLPHREITYNGDQVLVDGLRSDGIDNRIKILKRSVLESDAIQSKKFRDMRRSERAEFVKGKKLIYIYHNQIDSIGDTLSTESQVFDACKDTVHELYQLTHLLFKEFDSKSVYITADHGFMYTQKALKEDEQITLNFEVNEDTVLNRRYFISSKSVDSTQYLQFKLTSFGSDKQLLAPKHYLRFRMAGGGTNYIHGGLSIQELMVPVLMIRPSSNSSKQEESVPVQLSLISPFRKITNLSFMLEFFQNDPIRDNIKACNFFVQFVDINDRVISDKHVIVADKTSQNSSDRSTKKQFTLKQQKYDSNATYYLVIGNNEHPNEVYSKIEFSISVLFSDDFGL